MTNTNTPFGFALSHSQDASYSGVVTQCYIPASNSNKLYVGDAVVKSGGSNTTEFLGHKAGSLPTIAKGAATGALSGVIVGFVPNGDTWVSGALPASTEAIAYVIDNPMARFNIQANGAVTASMVGKYGNISVSTAGNDYSGISGMALNVATVDADSTLQVQIVGIVDAINNELGNYSIVEVVLNKPTTSVDLSDYLTVATAETTYQPILTAGDNVTISDENVISATDTTYTAGTGIAISDENVISTSEGQ